jgi:hypothetical protein
MPGPSSPYTPPSTPIPPELQDLVGRLARQITMRGAVRGPEIPNLNARSILRPFVPMLTTGEGAGRPVLNMAGRDPLTWNAAKGTAEQINARQAANQAAIAERMAAYNAARPTPTQGTAGGRPVIQVGVNAGPSIFGRISRGGARLFGR